MPTASPSHMTDTISISTGSPPSTSTSSLLGPDAQGDGDSRLELAPEYYSVEISDIDLNHIPKVGWNSLDDRFWLQIIADGKIRETSVANRGSLCWRDKFTFNVRKSSILTFRLYARRYVHEDKFIGSVEKLIDTCPDDTVVFKGWSNPMVNDDLNHTSLMCGITKRKLSPEEAAAEATKQQIRVSNIIIHHLPRIKLISLDDHFFVQIEVDGKVACITDVQRGHSLQWKHHYMCDYRKDSRIQLKVFAHRHIHKDQLVYIISDGVESFLRRGFIRREFSGSKKENEIPASIEFQVTSSTSAAPDGSHHEDDITPVPDDGGVIDEIIPSSVKITDICLTHLPKIGMVAFNDQFFVQLEVEGETQSTSSMIQKGGSISWKDKYIFHVPETTFLSLKVYARGQNDEYIGMVRGQIGAFLQNSVYEGQLITFNTQSKNSLDARLSFRVRRSSSFDRGSRGSVCSLPTRCSTQQHTDTVATSATGTMVQAAAQLQTSTVETLLDNTMDAFSPLLLRIDTFVQIGRAFSEAHPYTKMAFMILTAAYEVIRRQHARDDSVRKLTSTMCESYNLVSDAEDLCRFQGQVETINLLARQTIECAYFIRDYALYKSGATNCILNLLSNIDATILNYNTAFTNIRMALEQKVVVNTQLVVWRVHDALKDLAAKVDLSALPYAPGASYHAQKSYDNMPVNEDLLTEISDWVNGQNNPTIYLLIGPYGSEASAAAYTMARKFDDISRLGSSYCLDRTRKTEREPTNLFSTIARDLADHDPEFMACLANKVKRRAMGCSPHIPTQFDFILSSAQQLTSFGPVLIVIDALDACGDAHSRADILSVLKQKADTFPPNFKFLITCLPKTDVAITLCDKAHILRKELDMVVTNQLSGEGFTTGRTKPRPSTPPIQTAWPQDGYFSVSKSPSSGSDTSSIPSSIAPSIFDGGLSTFSPVSDMSSPASSITLHMDTGSPKMVKRIEAREECYSVDSERQMHTYTLTTTKQTVKHHATSTPRSTSPYIPMLNEPNAHLFITDAPDILSVVPRVNSARPQTKKRAPARHETIIRGETQTTVSQPIALLSSVC